MTVVAKSLGTVPVGPFTLMDLGRRDLVDHVVSLVTMSPLEPVLVYALHVAGLNARGDEDFVHAMRRADVVYADGGSVVLLARLAGARAIERAATTDVGYQIFDRLAAELGRPVRAAMVGGPPGLSDRAARALERQSPVHVVLSDHGYHQDWTGPLAAVRAVAPDVVVVGMGAPREMLWCEQHRRELPASLVLTCGGWFGHMVGDERRAPTVLRRSGVEWVARVAQSPTRLGPRYATGIWSTMMLAAGALRLRSKHRSAL